MTPLSGAFGLLSETSSLLLSETPSPIGGRKGAAIIILEILGWFIFDLIGGVIFNALIEAILWPLQKLRELAFYGIAAIDKYFAH
jgi:hypothetical protein